MQIDEINELQLLIEPFVDFEFNLKRKLTCSCRSLNMSVMCMLEFEPPSAKLVDSLESLELPLVTSGSGTVSRMGLQITA